MQWYSLTHPSEEDEFTLSGLTPVKSVIVKPHRVQEAAVQLECKVVDTIEIKNASGVVSSTVVMAEVVMAHVNKHVYDEDSGTVLIDKLRPIARVGGNTYSQTRECFDIERPGKAGAERKAAQEAAAKAKF